VIDSGTRGYYPVVWLDEFWLLREHLVPLNDSMITLSEKVTSEEASLEDKEHPRFENGIMVGGASSGKEVFVSLSLSYSPISLIKWQLYLQMQQSFEMQESMGTAMEGESDEFKRMITDTNPYLLGLTFVVTILHSIFDFLAFKNDIQFWKNKKSMEGMSVQTIFMNTVCQVFFIFWWLLSMILSFATTVMTD
jgi:hypothetical protein